MTNIVSPHDRVFKSALSDIRVARDFFSQHLAPEVLKAIDLDALSLCPHSYIDNELKLSQSDVLYKTTIHGQPGYLFLLLEHQSTPDKYMPFRMLKYHIGIWDEHIKQAKEEGNTEKGLPLIVGLVFYNGKEPYSVLQQAIREMEEGPPQSTYRSRLQTTVSSVGQKPML